MTDYKLETLAKRYGIRRFGLKDCWNCRGSGTDLGGMARCLKCNGSGKVPTLKARLASWMDKRNR